MYKSWNISQYKRMMLIHLESKIFHIFSNASTDFHLSFQSNHTQREGNNVILLFTQCECYSLCWFNCLPLSHSLCTLPIL